MSQPSFQELMDRLREGDESVEIEAKRARQIDRSILESVCALSNEPGRGGGYLLLGVVRNEARLFPDYEVVGVTEVDKLQSDLATQCRNEFNIPICPQVFVENLDKKTVLWAFVPEVDPHANFAFRGETGEAFGVFTADDGRGERKRAVQAQRMAIEKAAGARGLKKERGDAGLLRSSHE